MIATPALHGNHVLARPSLGPRALDQGVLAVSLAVFVARVSAQEHAGLLGTRMIGGRHGIKV